MYGASLGSLRSGSLVAIAALAHSLPEGALLAIPALLTFRARGWRRARAWALAAIAGTAGMAAPVGGLLALSISQRTRGFRSSMYCT